MKMTQTPEPGGSSRAPREFACMREGGIKVTLRGDPLRPASGFPPSYSRALLEKAFHKVGFKICTGFG